MLFRSAGADAGADAGAALGAFAVRLARTLFQHRRKAPGESVEQESHADEATEASEPLGLDGVLEAFVRRHPERGAALVRPSVALLRSGALSYRSDAPPFDAIVGLFRPHHRQHHALLDALLVLRSLAPSVTLTQQPEPAACAVALHHELLSELTLSQAHCAATEPGAPDELLADCLAAADAATRRHYFSSLLHAVLAAPHTHALAQLQRLMAVERRRCSRHGHSQLPPPPPLPPLQWPFVNALVPLLLLTHDIHPSLPRLARFGCSGDAEPIALPVAPASASAFDEATIVATFAHELRSFFENNTSAATHELMTLLFSRASASSSPSVAPAASVPTTATSSWPMAVRLFALLAERPSLDTAALPRSAMRLASLPLSYDPVAPGLLPPTSAFVPPPPPPPPLLPPPASLTAPQGARMPAAAASAHTTAVAASGWFASHFVKPLLRHIHTPAARTILTFVFAHPHYSSILFAPIHPNHHKLAATSAAEILSSDPSANITPSFHSFLRHLSHEAPCTQEQVLSIWRDACVGMCLRVCTRATP